MCAFYTNPYRLPMVPVLQGEQNIRSVIQTTSIEGLALISANAYLDGIERTPQLGNDPYAHERLRRSLMTLNEDFDFCFIDTPPSLGWLTQSAFFAAHYSVICVIPQVYSVIALRRLTEFHESIKHYFKDWIEASKIQSGPLFCPINHHSQLQPKHLSEHAIALIIKRNYYEEKNPFAFLGIA